MKGLFLYLVLLLFGYESADAMTNCGSCWFGFFNPDCDHDYTKDCNRCKELGGEFRNSCGQFLTSSVLDSFGIGGTPYGKIRLQTFNVQPFKLTTIYSLQTSSCNGVSFPWESDGCSVSPKNSSEVILDSNKIVGRESDCGNNLQKVSKFNICLIKLEKNVARSKYASDLPVNSDDFMDVVCALQVDGGDFRSVGCAPYPMPSSPPPFTPGYLPSLSFMVPVIGHYSGFNTDTLFQSPVAMVNSVMGSDIIDTMTFNIPISSNDPQVCQKYKSGSINFCGKIDSSRPDQISISKGSLPLGEYPRPAIEQKKNDLSIFPCYSTYSDKNNNKYQGIFAFAIDANKGDKIGSTEDGKALYLGPNYLPSLFPDKIGDIKDTKCDLCINAAEGLYSGGYNGMDGKPIIACKIGSHKINKLAMQDRSTPLRVDMFDIDEQQQSTKNYSYVSESALLSDYLVHIRPVIPIITNDEAESDKAVISTNNNTCNSYTFDPKGMIFIKPAGIRNRDYCLQGSAPDPNHFVTLCNDSTDGMYGSICPGLYQGADQNQTTPDKICLMSNDSWDFISGRYQDAYIKNLNGDLEVVPKMSCTFLPGCKTLGIKTVPNIGNAVWNVDANFNQTANGTCDESNKYSYRYEIDKYDFVDQQNSQQYGADLSQLKANMKDKPFIAESDLTPNLKALYNSNQNVFKCTKIYPEAKCIGGIYGNLTRNTDCLQITNIPNNKLPLKCNPTN